MNLCDRVLALLQAAPSKEGWVDAREIARVGGFAAWRTRISDLRKPPYSLVIENRVTVVGYGSARYRRSEYRLVAGEKTAAA